MKPLEASQRSVKIKIKLIFILIQLSEMHGAGRGNLGRSHKKQKFNFI